MNLKNLGIAAALAALCLVPAAAADTPNDPWGPDVSVTVDNTLCTSTFDLQDLLQALLGPAFAVGGANVHSEDCAQTVTYDGDNVKAECAPFTTPVFLSPAVTVHGDCDVDVA
jgi:hypothetical protein